MTTSTINESQRKAARVAGFFYLLTFAIVVAVNLGINERLMVAGDATQTVRNRLLAIPMRKSRSCARTLRTVCVASPATIRRSLIPKFTATTIAKVSR